MNSSQSDAEKRNENSYVLDASALLASILGEPGSEVVEAATTTGSVIGAVNLAEVVTKLTDLQYSQIDITRSLNSLTFEVLDFNAELARATGSLRAPTRHLGLSLGDRACLALALSLGLPVLTADRNWANVDVGVEVVLCR